MGLKRHIPNALTLANLFLGCVALTRIPSGNLYEVAGLIAGCLALDFMDGLLARWLKAQSELGRQLDSLADLVSFGVVPGMVVFSQMQDAGGSHVLNPGLSYLSLAIPIAAALRLARFNLDDSSQDAFKGLPTPANALFWISFSLLLRYQPEITWVKWFSGSWQQIVLIGVTCALMVSSLPLFSFKMRSLSFNENWYRYTLILGTAIGVAAFSYGAFPFLILFYILLSIILNYTA